MGQTHKRSYDHYTLAFKLRAVRPANHPSVKTKDIAEGLWIHPVMLYRWCMEHRNGTLVENEHIKKQKPSPKRVNLPRDSEAAT
ncbi:transposase [Marinobacter sp. RI1]|uniref:transposase n=1 Tax=Marinobacter sp. RI1 TaxID=3158171 RepID=UPI0034E88E1C